MNSSVTELRDSVYYSQLARGARLAASAHKDPIVARHLRETAVKHDRLARKLARAEAAEKLEGERPKGFFSLF